MFLLLLLLFVRLIRLVLLLLRPLRPLHLLRRPVTPTHFRVPAARLTAGGAVQRQARAPGDGAAGPAGFLRISDTAVR